MQVTIHSSALCFFTGTYRDAAVRYSLFRNGTRISTSDVLARHARQLCRRRDICRGTICVLYRVLDVSLGQGAFDLWVESSCYARIVFIVRDVLVSFLDVGNTRSIVR